MNRNPHVAVVGATGAVGLEMIKTLGKRAFPVGRLTLLASARSAGRQLPFRDETIPIQELTRDSFNDIDIALFSAGGGISKEFAPLAVRAGCVVVDNSSAFRMDPSVPLIVPEVNPTYTKENRLFSVGNCTAILLCTAINPLLKLGNLQRLIVTQAQNKCQQILDRGTFTADDRKWLIRISQLLLLSVF